VIAIREIAAEDAEAAGELCGELGYPCAADEMKARIERITGSNDHRVFVACDGDAVVGWIEVVITHHLAAGLRGEVTGLIISNALRSGGIGGRLLAQAEQWLAARGVAEVVVRSRTTRERAHRFYLREGYTVMKTSTVFSKRLPR